MGQPSFCFFSWWVNLVFVFFSWWVNLVFVFFSWWVNLVFVFFSWWVNLVFVGKRAISQRSDQTSSVYQAEIKALTTSAVKISSGRLYCFPCYSNIKQKHWYTYTWSRNGLSDTWKQCRAATLVGNMSVSTSLSQLLSCSRTNKVASNHW